MITTSRLLLRAGLSTAIAASGAVSELAAQEVKLPAALTFTAYDTGTSGFNIAVAVGKGDDAQAFRTAWLGASKAALQKAGLDVIFD